jgi:hypothetical protein
MSIPHGAQDVAAARRAEIVPDELVEFIAAIGSRVTYLTNWSVGRKTSATWR